MSTTLKQQLLEQIDALTPDQQRRLLDFAVSLREQPAQPPAGVSGDALVALAQELAFDPDDLAAMQRTIDEDCEQIDYDEW